jgi:flagellar hook-associated protein 1 FlgK
MSFFELNVASSGLFTAKSALKVVSHNITNAATPGYTRQIAHISARTPLNHYNGKGMIGTGSQVVGIGQIRNFYLDTKFWSASSRLGEHSAKNIQNALLETIFNETEETGFKVQFDRLFATLTKDLSVEAGSLTARLNTVQQANTLATMINSTAAKLVWQQKEVDQEIRSMVNKINTLGETIQSLNRQIYQAEVGGRQANDLRDQRALAVDELSGYVNVDVAEIELNKNLLTGESEKKFYGFN